ncbi:hypothetical protein Tco_1293734 [Tanacetum coccineum]
MNEKGVDSSKSKEEVKEESKEEVQKESKEEESTKKRKLGTKKRKGGHIKMIARKKARKQSDVDMLNGKKSVMYARLNKGSVLRSYINGFRLILWGDLKIMMESSIEGNEQSDFWSGQQDWKIVTWRLYESCGVCILEFEDGIVIHMLVERRYPLSKDLV